MPLKTVTIISKIRMIPIKMEKHHALKGCVSVARLWWVGVLVLAMSGCAGFRSVPHDAEGAQDILDIPLRQPKLGVALGGGAARGFAHIGVIQVLEAHGIQVDLLAGTSAGSWVAVLYASGMNGRDLERAALSMEEVGITDWTLPLFGRGLIRGEAMGRYVNEHVNHALLQQLRLPVGVLATDLRSGRGVLFQQGDTGLAVRASSAVPGVFTPVRIAGRDYVDGGLVAPVPVDQVRAMGADVVLAIDISSTPSDDAGTGIVQVLLRTFTIMGQSINQHALARADVVVRPALGDMGSAAFAMRERAIAQGREAMQAAMPQLQEAIAANTRATP